MRYTLYNKRLKRRLMHPGIGLWYTLSYEEAEEMLEACLECLKNMGMDSLLEDFEIVEIDSDGNLV